jgi:hypothetical protein
MDHPNHPIAGREEDWTGELMDQVCTLEALENGYRKVKENSKNAPEDCQLALCGWHLTVVLFEPRLEVHEV